MEFFIAMSIDLTTNSIQDQKIDNIAMRKQCILRFQKSSYHPV